MECWLIETSMGLNIVGVTTSHTYGTKTVSLTPAAAPLSFEKISRDKTARWRSDFRFCNIIWCYAIHDELYCRPETYIWKLEQNILFYFPYIYVPIT